MSRNTPTYCQIGFLVRFSAPPSDERVLRFRCGVFDTVTDMFHEGLLPRYKTYVTTTSLTKKKKKKLKSDLFLKHFDTVFLKVLHTVGGGNR